MSMTVTSGPALNENLAGVYSSGNVNIVTIKGDASYPFGGYPASATQFGFSQKIVGILTPALSQVVNGYFAFYDIIGNSIRIYNWSAVSATINEVASTTNLGGVQITALAYGW